MATKTATERLDYLHNQVEDLQGKIDVHEKSISTLKGKILEIRMEILELDKGRRLEAAERVMAEHPEFAKLVKIARDDIEVEAASDSTKKVSNRGRPPKAKNLAAATVKQ